jgi:hypothetical protein
LRQTINYQVAVTDMVPLRHVTRFALLAGLLALPAAGVLPASTPKPAEPGFDYVQGQPWTAFIPDPDKYQWDAHLDRPGYRYRKMTPNQERFYDYVQAKRKQGRELSWADNMFIRRLQAARSWPEVPAPNAFWRAYMRYMRGLRTDDLNLAQRMMLSEMIARGLVPQDMPPSAGMQRLVNYLRSGPFEARNWFEHFFGRVEPWLSYTVAASGTDMTGGGTPAGVFPADGPFNGMQITYNVSGATLGKPTDTLGFDTRRSYSGVLQAGTLHISGKVSVGGYGADLVARVWAGSQEQKLAVYVKNEGASSNTKTFDLSVPVPKGTATGGFAIGLDGHYSMGGGSRGLHLTGQLEKSAQEKQADRDAADAKWRAEVEKTLRTINAQDSPASRDLAEMRQALQGTDAAWKAYVDSQQRKLGYGDSPQELQYWDLKDAIQTGGDRWEKYVRAHSGGTTATAPSSPKPVVLAGGSSSVALPQRANARGGTIALRLNYSRPGVILDTVGINAARPGDYSLRLAADGTLSWQIYYPAVQSPFRFANGWHVLTSNTKLSPGTWYDLAVGYGAGGVFIKVGGRIVAHCEIPLKLSDSQPYLGDFPGDDQWGSRYDIHPSLAGQIGGVTFTP